MPQQMMRVAVTAALLISVSVASCSTSSEAEGDPTSGGPPGTSTSSSATSSATPSTPSPSSTTRRFTHTTAGADQFVRAYFNDVNKYSRSPQTGALDQYADPACTGCQGFSKQMDHWAEIGAKQNGSAIRIRKLYAFPEGQGHTVLASVDVLKGQVLAPDGSVIEDIPLRPDIRRAFLLSWDSGTWKISKLQTYSGSI